MNKKGSRKNRMVNLLPLKRTVQKFEADPPGLLPIKRSPSRAAGQDRNGVLDAWHLNYSFFPYSLTHSLLIHFLTHYFVQVIDPIVHYTYVYRYKKDRT